MTKMKMKTPDGKWFTGFIWHLNGTQCNGVDILSTMDESKALVCGKTEASERFKIAKKYGNVELTRIVC